MKIIELLNKIANDEELPKKIKYRDCIFENRCVIDYWCKEAKVGLDELILMQNLNDEVEIIEEQEDKKIEKLDIENDGNTITLYNNAEWTILNNVDVAICNKINEIIDKVNELEKRYEKQDK